METDATTHRYTLAARLFHWFVFAFVALAYVLINLRGFAPRGSHERSLIMQGHIVAGLVVLALVLPRLLHRLRHRPPVIVPPIAGWERVLSKWTHAALYVFLFVQPLLGLATVFAEGRPVVLPFTSLHIPSPFAPDHALGERLGDIHGWIGTVFYFVIGLHIAAALWHHFVRHDDTLRRMT